MNLIIKKIIFGFGCILFWFQIQAQDKVNLSFQTDDSLFTIPPAFEIHIIQEGILHRTNIGRKIQILAGVSFTTEFMNYSFPIKKIRSSKIFQDTTIFLQLSKMEEIVIKPKKFLVKRVLDGYEYKPGEDSIFYDKNILFAMQRLPFLHLDFDALQYKQGGKILFMINGKERAGVSNWNDILRNIKAKDIYRVKMITDLPSFIQARGYDVILNLETADVHLHGQSLSVSIIADQRKNINSNIDLSILQNHSDYSFQFSNQGDKLPEEYRTAFYQKDALISENKIHSVNDFNTYSFNSKYGLRIDSARDFAASFYVKTGKTHVDYRNDYNYPVQLSNQKSIYRNEKFVLNVSYYHRIKKGVTTYLALSGNKDFQSSNALISYTDKIQFDNIRQLIKTLPENWVLDYNYLNNSHKKYRIELGSQMYVRATKQDYSAYSVDDLSGSMDHLLFNKKDSFVLNQFSFLPYLKYTRNISKVNNFILRANSEIYTLKNLSNKKSVFFLPSLSLTQNHIFRNNSSLAISAGLNYYKPGLDFLVQLQNTNPFTDKLGSANLKPSKVFYVGTDWRIDNKYNLAQQLTLSHGYDITRFFTKFNLQENKFYLTPDDNNKSNTIKYSIDVGREFPNRINIYTHAELTYSIFTNNYFKTSNKGLSFNMTNSAGYFIGKNLGFLGIQTYLNGRDFSAQGSYPGTISYLLYYANSFFSKKIAVTLMANEFLQKNRKYETYTFIGETKQYSSLIKPYRLFSVRIAYKFTNIRLQKIAQERKAIIQGELNLD